MSIIPYPRKQGKGVKGILGVDRKFRNRGPPKFRRAYKRVAADRVFSRLKDFKFDSTQSERASQNHG